MAEYKVLITSSGLGSRLGNITKFTNKSLVRVGNKPVISHIIESYPEDIEFIVTLGHYGSHVKQYLSLAYPDRKIQFVEIDNYMGDGSSLLYSMVACEKYLQCPFIFHACDIILSKNYVKDIDFSSNWSIGGACDISEPYRTINSVNRKISSINEKGESHFDYVYVGVSGFKDYKNFWENCKEILNTVNNKELSDCHVIRRMNDFKVIEVDTWYDIGNIDSLKKTRTFIKGTVHVLDKEDENIFVFDDFVIKFFSNKKICSDRVTRTQNLKGLVPELIDSTENFYKYKFVQADLLSDVATPLKITHLLEWAKENLWVEKKDESYKDNALSFYKEKTIKRVNMFLDKYGLEDTPDIINETQVPSLREIFEKIDFNSLIGKNPTGFHGDFILDNILTKNGKFILIDWRQDFNGSVNAGDMHYDIAKLNHNLILNHQVLSDNLYKIDLKENITCDIHIKKSNLDCKKVLKQFCFENHIPYDKIQILTSLIWINMAPLHERPLDMFLYYFGKHNLFLNLNRQ